MNKGGKASTAKTLEITRKMAAYGIVPEMSSCWATRPTPTPTPASHRVHPQGESSQPGHGDHHVHVHPGAAGRRAVRAGQIHGSAFPETLEGWIDPSWQEFSQRRSVSMPWLNDPIRRRITNFQWVLNAYHPTTTDTGMSSIKRNTLRAASAWRYRLGFYDHPLELRALHKVMSYQRPETTGF